MTNEYVPRSDSDIVLVRILKDMGEHIAGQVAEAPWKHAKTWIKSECAVLIEKDEETMSTLKDPDLFNRITVSEFDKRVVGEVDNRKAIFLNACGIFVENNNVASYNLCVDSESGAGKDYVVDAIVKYFHKVINGADRGWVKRKRISPTVFNYWHTVDKEPDWTWDGKICYLPDLSKSVANHEVFKVMSSEGSEATITVNNTAVDVEVRGKPVMFITTASSRPSKEMLRRFPRISLDESREQTREIMKRKAKFAAEGKTATYEDSIRKSLPCLKRVKVRIPFAEDIVKHLPDDHIIMRTHFDRFLDYIKASAALHQYQRKKEGGFVLAEAPQDYEIARIVLIQTTSNKFMIPLTKKEQQVLSVIKKSFKNEWFSVPELSLKVKFLSERKLYDYLDKLQEWFFDVDKHDRENSRKPVKVYNLKDASTIYIPTWEEIMSSKKRSVNSDASDTSFTSVESVDGTTDINELNEPLPDGIKPHFNLMRAKQHEKDSSPAV